MGWTSGFPPILEMETEWEDAKSFCPSATETVNKGAGTHTCKFFKENV